MVDKSSSSSSSSSSDSESEQPLIKKTDVENPALRRFRNIVLTKVMGKRAIESVRVNIDKKAKSNIKNERKSDSPEIIKREVINENTSTIPSRISASVVRSQGRKDTDVLDSAEVKDLEWTKRCLENESSPEATCQLAKISVCHISSYHGEDGILDELLKLKPELYKRADARGRTALHFAAWEGNLDCLAILLGLKVGDFQKVDLSKFTRRKGRKEKIYQEFEIKTEVRNVINSLEGEKIQIYDNLCDSTHSCSSPTKALDVVWSSCTPLHVACARVKTDCVLALLACGADITKHDSEGRTPLDVCGLANKYLGKMKETSGKNMTKIIEAIIRYGQTNDVPRKLWLTNKPNETSPLHIAAMLGSKKAMKLLMDIGATLDLLNETGQTPLHLAIDHRKPIILRAIANFSFYNKNHIESRNMDEYTPLQYAVKQEWVEGVSILLESDANITNNNNKMKQTALHLAAEIGNFEITNKLLEKLPNKKEWIDVMDKSGETPLFKAIVNGNPVCVRCFLHDGAAYNLNFNGYTVLHKAMQSDNINVLNALLEAENMRDLLNIADEENGMTPLHWAASENRSTYINILINFGADPTLRTKKEGYTPLHIAAEKGRNDAIRELLKYDKAFLMDEVDNSGWLPFHRAAHQCHRESIEIFLKNGSNLAEIVEAPITGKKRIVANIIKDNMPRSAEFYNNIFNMHMIRNECSLDQVDCSIKFNYSIIVPHKKDSHIQMTAVEALFGYGCNFELSKLIFHPYIESFLFLKWTILKKFYLLILGIYSLYVLLLTDMIINLFHEDYLNWTTPLALKIKQIFIIVVVSCILILELPFIRLKGKMYFKRIEAWIKLASIIMSIVIMVVHWTKGISATRLVVAITLLLSWMEITILLSRFPQFGFYFQMFATVAIRVIKVFALFGFFVVFGFSLIFWILIRQNESFMSPWNSLIKTVVMMTSEFDYSSMMETHEPSGDQAVDENQPNAVVVQLFFILFLICVPIVFMNLLLALAVSDVKDLEIEGKIQRLQEQIEFLSNLEALAYRINLRINIGNKLKVENKMTVYPGRPFWDPRNNLPMDLMESICENIHERISEEEKEKQMNNLIETINHMSTFMKEQKDDHERSLKELIDSVKQLSEDIKNYKPVVTESRPSLWPSISTLKSVKTS